MVVTYNGDYFDWPFMETRCDSVAGLSLYKELGIKSTVTGGAGECVFKYGVCVCVCVRV